MIDAKESAKIIRDRKICALCLEAECKTDCEHSLGYSVDKTKTAFDDAIEALEKQIPKKAVTKGFVIYHCPNCNGVLNDLVKYPYCDRCGQAIDWSDGNA